MQMLITLNRLDYCVQILYDYVFKHCPVNGMQNYDEAALSIILAGRAILSVRPSTVSENAFNS